ncbi:MAG: hypothetical protein Q9184_004826 [Pyrenodesmia sp. 2 TL-2023]
MFVKNILSAVISASAAAAAALSVKATTQNAEFDAMANTNMAVYWGQGPSQPRLAHFCEDSNIDIIPIAFLNIFPDQVNGGYPGTNFGNQCGSETYENEDGSWSPLLSNCPFIGPDIKTCQAMGKKILLSLGGAIPTNQSIDNDATATSFALFLWNAFGPENATYDGPRPFGDAVVDGFDFDIESDISDNDATTQYRGYGTMIDVLRTCFATDAEKEYYISGSPQCVIPDAHLAHPIETSWFDFLLIQFYNTPQCSARAHFDASYGRQGDTPSDISFDAWVAFIRNQAMNKDVKLYIGLPAAPLTQLAYDTYMYIAPNDVADLIDVFQCRYPKEFGGIMVWEATYSEQNLIEGKPYVDVIKAQLTDSDCAKQPVTSIISSSTFSTSSSLAIPSSAAASVTISSTETTSPTSSSTVMPSASASLPSSPSNTGIWNATMYTHNPTAGTGSSPTPFPSSTGIWNATTYTHNPSAEIGSSSLSYPSSTGLWNSTSSVPAGTGSSSIPPYPTSTGIWNSTSLPTSTGTSYTSSSAPADSSISLTGTGTSTSAVPSYFSFYPTGASSGFSSSVLATSVPYPTTNGASSSTTSTPGGISQTTETITVTDCPPEVTSCPVRTTITTYPVTTSSSVALTFMPTNSLETTASISSPSSSVPTNSPNASTPISSGSASVPTDSPETSTSDSVIYTTETITMTKCPPEVTSCPVQMKVTTYSVTLSSSAPVTSVPTNSPETTSPMSSRSASTPTNSHEATISVSSPSDSPETSTSMGTIYTTETIIITSCPPGVTNCPIQTTLTTYPVTPTSSAPVISMPTKSPETNTPVLSPSATAPVPIPTTSEDLEITTTLMQVLQIHSSDFLLTLFDSVTSYTTCPVTGIATVHGSTSVYTSSTVSTVITTIVSTIPVIPTPTNVMPPAGHGPAPGHEGSASGPLPSAGSGNSPINSGSHPAPQPQRPAHGGLSSPSHGSSAPSSGNGNSPIGAGNSPGSSSNRESTVPSFENSPAQLQQPEQPTQGDFSPSSGNGNSPIGAGDSPGSSSNHGSTVSGSGNSPTQPQQPAHGGPSPSSGSGTSPIGAGNSPAQPKQFEQPTHGASSPSSGYGSSPIGAGNPPASSSGHGATTSSIVNSPAQHEQPADGAKSLPSNAGNSPIGPGFSTTLQTSTRQLTATLQGNSPAGTGASGVNSLGGANPEEVATSASLLVTVTATLVPIPLHPSQTAHPTASGASGSGGLSSSVASSAPFPAGNGASSSGGLSSPVASSVPFPASNGTVPGVPAVRSGSAAPSASVSGFLPGSSPGAVAFTGAASKMGTRLFAVVMAGVVGALCL